MNINNPWVNWVLAFVAYLTIVSSFFVFGHEFTHVAANDFRFSGVCVLDCPITVDGRFSSIGVFLDKPVNTLASNELVAFLGGGVFAFVFVFSDYLYWKKKRSVNIQNGDY